MHGTLETKRPPIHKMEPATDKLIEAILFLISRAAERKCTLTQYDIVKSLFFADKSHLNRFGRPITFDNYVAMPNGPVPSLAYSILKNEADLAALGLREVPWDRVVGEHSNPKACLYRNPKRAASEDVLSESDMEALSDALATVMGLTFGQIKKLTHQDPAYVAAWGDGESNNAPMSYGMLFDVPDFDEAEHLQFLSQHR
jgi:uncharacterized phage-associated protein